MKLPPAITSKSNERVKALRASLNGKAWRGGDLLGLEGPNLLREAHLAGCMFDTIYLREGFGPEPADNAGNASKRLPALASLRTGAFAVLSAEVFDSVASTESPQGIAATWSIREPERQRSGAAGVTLLVEDVQDPGNLGTLIRSAAAFGAIEVCLTPQCTNHWSPKAVRASAGAVFRMPVRRATLTELAGSLRDEGARLFAAVAGFAGGHTLQAPHGALLGHGSVEATAAHRDESGAEGNASQGYSASLAFDADFMPPCAILVGNEGRGLSREALALADERVRIPCSVESLNAAVAGSVLLYEAMRQLPLRSWASEQGLRR